MKKTVETYILSALEAVRTQLPVPGNTRQVYEEFDGYAASLAAAIITSGLLPALAFYTDVHKKSNNAEKEARTPRRYKIMNAIAYTLRGNGVAVINTPDTGLLDTAIDATREQQAILKDQIIAASVALKLALRNFEHIKSARS